jgi:hypothetical protein
LDLGLANLGKSVSSEVLAGSLGFFYAFWCLCFFKHLIHHSPALLEFLFLWFLSAFGAPSLRLLVLSLFFVMRSPFGPSLFVFVFFFK